MTESNATSWTRPAAIVVAMVALALVLDGVDAQALGLAIPPLMREWGLTRADFAPIAAMSLLGMAIGATFGGLVGDRIGRRWALIGSIALFGLAWQRWPRAPVPSGHCARWPGSDSGPRCPTPAR
jgi:AAHS family 4-hydroxybenzoate transporter-like MFS transporter